MAIRLVLADDHPLVLQGLVHALATQAGFRVLATCTDGERALKEVRKQHPDLLVLDLRMPRMSGLTVIRQLREDGFTLRIVLLTALAHEEEVRKALCLGADAVFFKEQAPALLIRCLNRVYRGETWPQEPDLPAPHSRRQQHSLDEAISQLTPRETEMVRLVSKGLTNRDIATRLFITEGTVKLHLHHVFRKLGVRTRVKLTLYAHECGLV